MNSKYQNNLSEFELLCNESVNASIKTTGIEVPTYKHKYGSVIFSKVALHALAIQKLLPNSIYYNLKGNFRVLDIPSVAVLTRVLIETYYIFYYYIIDNVSEQESKFRFILNELHSYNERKIMIENINPNSDNISRYEGLINQKKAELESNEYFKKLTDKKYKIKILKAEKGITLSYLKISKKAGIDEKYHKAIYKFLSQYTHTESFSIEQLQITKANDNESLSLLSRIVELAVIYLSLSVRDFCEFYKLEFKNDISEIIKTSEYIVSHIHEI